MTGNFLPDERLPGRQERVCCILVEVIPQNLPADAQVTVSDPRLMSQVVRVREGVCALISVFVHSERCRCEYWSAYAAAAFACLKWKDSKVCEIVGEGCHVR